MTLMLELAPEEEAHLRERAAQTGQAAETIAAALLKQILQSTAPQIRAVPIEAVPSEPPGSPQPMTDADFDAYWGPYIGVIHGSHEPWSENCGEKFTDYLVEKKRQGHLCISPISL